MAARAGSPRGGVAPGRVIVALVAALIALVLGALVIVTPRPSATAAAAPSPAAGQEAPLTLTLFWGDGCPKCESERKFLAQLQREHPTLTVQQFEVWKHTANRSRFEATARHFGVDASAVPATVVEDRLWIGFTAAIRDDIRTTVETALRGGTVPRGVYGRTGSGTCKATDEICTTGTKNDAEVDVPFVGRVDVGDKSLVVSTLVIGFVDGINPCSLWVISILLAIVIRTGSRRRVLAIGSAFLVVTAGMYALYMAGMYSALSVISYLDAIQLGVGIIAGIAGIIAVKDYFWYKRGVSLTIPESSKPGIYKRVRDVAGSKSLLLALGATTLLAVAVSLIETPCTAGFPLLWTGLLASHHVGLLGSSLLFLLYMIPFLLDEMFVFFVAVFTMRATKLQEKHGRLLKLVAGTIMIALAGTMIFAPAVMEDVLGATLVFAVAIVVAGAVHGITTRWRHHRQHHPRPRPTPAV
jgi:cytochrome c biogenesis protein CcdA